jgi:hypothetical protein
MGYYSAFTLSVSNPDGTPAGDEVAKKAIGEFREECEDAMSALKPDGTFRDNAKWYDCNEDLTEFSEKYPDLLFELNVEGEDETGYYRLYCLDGAQEVCKGEMAYPPRTLGLESPAPLAEDVEAGHRSVTPPGNLIENLTWQEPS